MCYVTLMSYAYAIKCPFTSELLICQGCYEELTGGDIGLEGEGVP